MYTERLLFKPNNTHFRRYVLKMDIPIIIDYDKLNIIISLINNRVKQDEDAIITFYDLHMNKTIVDNYDDLMNKTINVIAIDVTKH